MTTIPMAAFASFGPYELPSPTSASEALLLCGRSSAGSLEQFRFRFVDGQRLRPGAHGIVRLTFPSDMLPTSTGPLPIWAGRIIGQLWGLHLVHCALPEISRIVGRIETCSPAAAGVVAQ